MVEINSQNLEDNESISLNSHSRSNSLCNNILATFSEDGLSNGNLSDRNFSAGNYPNGINQNCDSANGGFSNGGFSGSAQERRALLIVDAPE